MYPEERQQAIAAQVLSQGRASVMYRGEHIDNAHVATARDIVSLAHSFESGVK